MENIWIDSLHLLLRLSDRVEMALEERAKKNDKIPELNYAVNSQCGFTYTPHWSDKELKWPSLTGNQKLSLLELSDCSAFSDSPEDSASNSRCISLLKNLIQFLQCHHSHDDHDSCIHQITTFDDMKEEVKQMSK